MIWFALALTVTGCSLFAAGFAAHAMGRLGKHALNGLFVAANSFNLVASVLMHNRVTGGICAGSLALSAWVWWNGGGGDATKRRLRKWARKFTGVRRTAPAGAS